MNERKKQLVSPDSQNFVKPAEREIDFNSATLILQKVAATKETDIKSTDSQIDLLSGFSYSQIQDSFKIYGTHLLLANEPSKSKEVINYQNSASDSSKSRVIIKNLPNDEDLVFKITTIKHGQNDFHIIGLNYRMCDEHLNSGVEMTTPLNKIKDISDLNYHMYYDDYRNGVDISAKGVILSLPDFLAPEQEKIKANQLLWLSLRWLSANMLAWEKPGVILPEQLDNISNPKITDGGRGI
jgi:hypothetical protein